MEDPLLETAPWNKLLTFGDPVLEAAYWTRRVRNVLLPCDRAINSLGILASMVVFSRIQHMDVIAWMLFVWSILIPASVLLCTYALGERYVNWRPWLIVPEKISMILITGILKTRIPLSCGDAFIPSLVHSNVSALIILTLGLQNKFMTNMLLQIGMAALATRFSSMYCRLSHQKCGASIVLENIATRIDSAEGMLMTLSWMAPKTEFLEGEAACLFTLFFYQWGISLVTGILLYILEAHSRIIYLLSDKGIRLQSREVLWKAWKYAILMSLWNCVVGLTIVSAVIRESI